MTLMVVNTTGGLHMVINNITIAGQCRMIKKEIYIYPVNTEQNRPDRDLEHGLDRKNLSRVNPRSWIAILIILIKILIRLRCNNN